jgi:hypothetical protein
MPGDGRIFCGHFAHFGQAIRKGPAIDGKIIVASKFIGSSQHFSF